MKKCVSLIVWILLALTLFGLCVFMETRVEGLLDADMSSELVLARLLSQEKRMISPNWYYSTELRVLNTQLVFAPLFWITGDWHTVRVAGSVILYLILLASAYYCCRQLKIRRMFPVVGILLLMPLSVPYFNNILRGVYYIPHAAISFVMLGMLAQYMRAERRGSRLALCCGIAALSFVAGLGGIRQLAVFYIPAALMAILLFQREPRGLAHEERSALPSSRLLQGAMLAAALAVLGFLVNRLVLTRFYSFSDYTRFSFTPLEPDRIVAVLRDFLAFFGYHPGAFASAALLQNLLTLILLTVVATAVHRFAFRTRPGDVLEHSMLAVYTIAASLVFILLYAFTDSPYHNTYQLPFMIFTYLLIGAWLESADWKKRSIRCCAALSAAVLLICGAVGYWDFAHTEEGESCLSLRGDAVEFAEIAQEMVESGYTSGYSTFWYGGNTLTELSDGAIDMYIWPNQGASSLDELYPWLQAKAHGSIQPDGPFFLMFRTADLGVLPVTKRLDDRFLIYLSDQYVAYGYESREQYEAGLLPSPA